MTQTNRYFLLVDIIYILKIKKINVILNQLFLFNLINVKICKISLKIINKFVEMITATFILFYIQYDAHALTQRKVERTLKLKFNEIYS